MTFAAAIGVLLGSWTLGFVIGYQVLMIHRGLEAA